MDELMKVLELAAQKEEEAGNAFFSCKAAEGNADRKRLESSYALARAGLFDAWMNLFFRIVAESDAESKMGKAMNSLEHNFFRAALSYADWTNKRRTEKEVDDEGDGR